MRYLLLLSILLSFSSCSIFDVPNKLTVRGIVKDTTGVPLKGADISFSNSKCSAWGVDTDINGAWNLSYVTGKAHKNQKEKKIICFYTVSLEGYKTKTGSFTYCISGKCTGDQQLNTQITLSEL